MIFVTGDTHGEPYRLKLQMKTKMVLSNNPREFNKNDYLIITGDFGCIWSVSPDGDKEKLDFLTNLPWTTLFVDGNHENFDRLDKFEKVEMFGDRVQKIQDSIYRLQRGKVYIIDGKKFFTMGGGYSLDKAQRREFISWWSQELPTTKEMDDGLDELEKHHNVVDYIITHSAPMKISNSLIAMKQLYHKDASQENGLRNYFQHIYDTVRYGHWYCGHFHEDCRIGNVHFLYESMERII